MGLFTDSLAHRGPDSRGEYYSRSGRLYLGHRRLAILDLSPSGHQPMMSQDKRYALTFNGEIYNFLEVREELKGKGFSFVGESDAEVLLNAFIYWGTECVHHLNGMWAFAIWDDKLQKLYLCRDRFGVKPLHYRYDHRSFAFASELKAFLALSDAPVQFNEGVVGSALCNANAIEATRETIVQGIMRLNPGYWLEIRQGHSKPILTRWWCTVDHLRDIDHSNPNEVTADFKELIEDACRMRMRSDVPIGTALSGGLDSSSVYAMMHQIGSEEEGVSRVASSWQNAFVSCYPDTLQDERKFAEKVVDHYDGKANFYNMSPELGLEHLEKYIFSVEEIYPYRGSIWQLYGNMRNANVSISIDGHGGDEILAGYHHYPLVSMLDASRGSAGLAPIASLKRMYESLFSDRSMANLKNLRNLLDCFSPTDALHFSSEYLRASPAASYYPDYSSDREKLATCSQLTHNLYFDFHFALLPTILRNFDRCSMAHGVEIRAPFLDYRVVTYAMSLGDEFKLGPTYTKQILRSSMKGLLPESIRLRKDKVGFLDPFIHFIEQGFSDMMMDVASSSSFSESNIWDGRTIKKRLQSAYEKKHWPAFNFFWPYVQAHLLQQSFREKQNEYISLSL